MLQIREGSLADLETIRSKLLRDFPHDEVKSVDRVRLLLSSRLYRLYWFVDVATAIHVGYAIVYQPPSLRMSWLDYFAIEPELRDRGYGLKAFQAICDLSATGDGLMFEVQPPTSPDPLILEEQRRRIAFYTRLGARQLDAPYYFPSASRADPLLLFFWPGPSTTHLARTTIQEMIKSVYEHVHSDVPGRNAILGQFINSINDQAF